VTIGLWELVDVTYLGLEGPRKSTPPFSKNSCRIFAGGEGRSDSIAFPRLFQFFGGDIACFHLFELLFAIFSPKLQKTQAFSRSCQALFFGASFFTHPGIFFLNLLSCFGKKNFDHMEEET